MIRSASEVPPQLDIELSQASGWSLIKAAGEIDLASVGQLEEAVEATLASGARQVAIDLTDITFLDSTGLRALISAHTRLEETEGQLAVIIVGGPVERLFDITGMTSTLHIHPSLESVTS
jgi:anti-anti-sigma factor